MDNEFKKSYVAIFNCGSYDESVSIPIAVFTDKDAANNWTYAMVRLIQNSIHDAATRELQGDYSGINYSVFGINSIRDILKFHDWQLKHDVFSITIDIVPILG